MFKCDGCGGSYRKKEIEKLYVLLIQSKLLDREPESEQFVFCSLKCLEDFTRQRKP